LMGLVERMLFGDPDKQHRVQPQGSLGARCDAKTALGACRDPGDGLRACRFALRQAAQTVRSGPWIGTAKTDLVNHRTGVKAGAAGGAKRREFQTSLSQKSFRSV